MKGEVNGEVNGKVNGESTGKSTGESSGAIAVGPFSVWVAAMRRAVTEGGTTDVPCGDCRACCESSHFVHVGVGERESLAAIPSELLFPAPGQPPGTRVMGYDERGRCPMLGSGGCTIYEQRPATCRVYDCRVFAAAGIDADRREISHRARRWAFEYRSGAERAVHAAVRAAAAYLADHPERLPEGVARDDPAQVALMALEIHEEFLDGIA